LLTQIVTIQTDYFAKLGGLEALPQPEKTLRAASKAGFSRLP